MVFYIPGTIISMAFFKISGTILGLCIVVLGFYYSLITGNYLIALTSAMIGFLFILAAR